TPWTEVLRSNRKNLDPVFFAVYGDAVYHHGAGFRGVGQLTRLHIAQAPKLRQPPAIPVVRELVAWIDRVRRHIWLRRTRERLTALSERLIARIQRGDSEWLGELT
ncbi:MAG TPA: hypothetical protein VNZ05_04625, partial [Solirubrobacteraceae bacterium]|nr:hypothetical protein [Solirubrobacteraceae bacterium]